MPNTAEAAAFLPAIEALRLELFRIEQEASDVRALLERLCAHAGIAGEQATAPGEAAMAPKAKGTRGQLKGRKKGSGGRSKDKTALSGGAKSEPPDKDTPTLAELGVSKRLVAESAAQAQSAMQDKDAEKLKAAVAAGARAERRAGALLIAMAGKVRPLRGISKVEAKRWRRAAGLSAAEFEAKLQRTQRKAVGAMGVAPEPAPAKPTPAKPESAKAHAAPPHPRMKLTPWTTDSTGALTRTLTAEVDGGGAEVAG